MRKTFKITLFGPQGSGKGTQAEMLGERYGVPILAVGDILRKEVKNQTEVGKLAASLINRGKLIPDEIVNKIIFSELTQDKYKNGFILDGYPRSMNQLEILEKSINLTQAIELMVSDGEVIKRLGGRRICSNCGAIYHIESKPPKKEGACDVCGKKLIVREDDESEAIKRRLAIYHQETEPILNYYFERKKLIRVNGEQPIERVFEDIVKALEKEN